MSIELPAALFSALSLLTGPLVTPASRPEGPEEPDPLPVQVSGITRAELFHHLRFLASDELRGREAGTPDAVRAARYLARTLERAGLEGGAADGRFLQEVPLVRIEHEREPELVLETWDGTRISGRFGVDFDVTVRAEPRVAEVLPLTVVRELAELPDEPRGERALWIDGSRSETRAWLAERGMGNGEGWGLCVARGFSRPRKGRKLPPPQLVRELPDADPADFLQLHGDLRTLLEAGEIRSIELRYGTRIERPLDFNVVGVLRGADPELSQEVVVVSAHYDHVGALEAGIPGHGHGPHQGSSASKGRAADEDRIYNGADDDASGTAAVLEIAEALAHGEAPDRTLVFFLAAGEEKGLLGTYHYIDHPSFPLARTVANLNLEMIGRPDELAGGKGGLWLTGFERTNLGKALQERGVRVVPDQRPDQNFFMRSDNIAFVKEGVVGQTLSSYNLHGDYHTVYDEIERIDFDHLLASTRVAAEAVRVLASGDFSPEWLPGGLPDFR